MNTAQLSAFLLVLAGIAVMLAAVATHAWPLGLMAAVTTAGAAYSLTPTTPKPAK